MILLLVCNCPLDLEFTMTDCGMCTAELDLLKACVQFAFITLSYTLRDGQQSKLHLIGCCQVV